MIHVNVDDTGLAGTERWFLFSALLGTAEDWANITDKWQAALDEPPRRISYFKMDEAVGFEGPFYGMSETDRNYKLTRLARSVVGEYAILEQTVTTDLPVVSAALRAKTHKPADNPYFWSFHHLINAIGLSLLEVNYNEPFEIFFDENPIWGPRAKAWWPVIRAMQVPELRAILPVDPQFRDDKKWLPLQAADMTAWLSRANQNGVNSFDWLREHLVGLKKSPHCIELGQKEIDLMFDPSRGPEYERKMALASQAFKETFVNGGARHFVPNPKKAKQKR